MSGQASALYEGVVTHQRVRPRRHRLRYRVFSVLFDLDELPALDARLRLFAHNRPGLVSLHDRDHGPASGMPLRPWVQQNLACAGIDIGGGPIRLLCYPRILGYVFNPLSVYFCHHRSGALAAILYEVHNTFGERHTYLIPAPAKAAPQVRQSCEKRFYVSPFIGVGGRYDFRVLPPGERLSIAITQKDGEGALLHASFTAHRRTFDDRTLALCLLRYPLMTLKVIGGIHWEALRLWAKGVPLTHRPSPPGEPVTIVAPGH